MSHHKTFRYGGLLLEQGLSWPLILPIPNAFLPASAIVSMKQHLGEAARCVVRRGDLVREGALVGKAETPSSSNIHAPVPGIVRDIRKVRMASGAPVEVVEIALAGSFDRLGKREEKYLWTSMSSHDMIQTLRERGVVEMGGEGRPIADLVSSNEKGSILILSSIESEPYLRTELSVLRERAKDVLEGFAILRRLLQPSRSIIIIDEADAEEPERLSQLKERLEPDIERMVLKRRYPQDMRNQILSVIATPKRALTAKELCVISPSTALAVFESLVHAKPVLERYVTVAGGALKRPAVLKVRIGTLIGDLFEECGGFLRPPERIVLGGPIRGESVYSLDSSITKLTGSVLALTAEETNSTISNACVRCGRCMEVCPERLAPAEIFRRLEKDLYVEALAFGLEDCTECGACGYICPSRLPLNESFRTGRKQLEAPK